MRLGQATPDASSNGMGDLSFDGTGIMGTGLFGYTPWYDTSQWTPVEWIAIAGGIWFVMDVWGGIKGSARTYSSRKRRIASAQRELEDAKSSSWF